MMRSIGSKVVKLLETITHEEVSVSTADIGAALKHLKKDKHDGMRYMWSNFLIWSPDSLMRSLATLMTAMLSHGHSPNCINVAYVTPIPKSGDICNSENYRGIALSSSIAKLTEIVLMAKAGCSIATSELQFAYKRQHSTSMCTFMLKETVSHYLNRGSEIYGCLIDASKAFDRLRHDKLLQILIRRKVPPAVIRLLMDAYMKQKISIRWHSNVSDTFSVSNGVKQGGIFSPVLFCLYMDELLNRLRSLGVGCHLGTTFVGALSYADDLTLLSPCVIALQRMLDTCQSFADEYDVMFNPPKSQCILFSNNSTCVNHNYSMKLCGQTMEWTSEVKHLGNIVTHNLDEYKEFQTKIGQFIYQVNYLKSNFYNVSLRVLVKLFNAYCCCFYGCQAWNLKHKLIESVCTKFNRGIRILLKLPPTTHRKYLPHLIDAQPVFSQFCKRFFKMHTTMLNSPNPTVNSFTRIVLADPRSLTSNNLNAFKPNNNQLDPATAAEASIIKDIINCNFSHELLSYAELLLLFNSICTG